MAEVIGFIADILGILGFLQSNFASSPDAITSKFRIGLALDGTRGLSNAGGNLPDVRVWNEVGGFLGAHYDPGNCGSGVACDVEVEQSVAQQPTYVLFSANDDAVCIAYMSATWPDEQKLGWLGSWGKACGASWYRTRGATSVLLIDSRQVLFRGPHQREAARMRVDGRQWRCWSNDRNSSPLPRI